MTWPHFFTAWPVLCLVVVALNYVAHRNDPPEPEEVECSIPDAEFEKLYMYAVKESFLDTLEAQLKTYPENTGKTFALLEIEVLRAENQFSLMTFGAVKSTPQ